MAIDPDFRKKRKKAGKEEGTTETQKPQEEGAEKAEAEKDKADAKEA